VKTLRASSYTLQASTNGRTWHTVAKVSGVTKRTADVLSFPRVRARWLRIRMTKGSQKPLKKTTANQNPPSTMPMLEELTANR
jgi:hypothetical protein